MKNRHYMLAAAALLPALVHAAGNDDPVLTKVMIDQLELRAGDGPSPLVLETQAWIGKDLNKLWLKFDGEYEDGQTREAELQVLYDRAVSPYWDMQLGWRHDAQPTPTRDWLAFGVQGLAPYWFDVQATAFVGEQGQVAGRLKAEYEAMLTQRWVLSPELELNLHSKDDQATGVGAGLSDAQVGLRLRYEFRREFAPYVGVNWSGMFGKTADLARDEGEDTSKLQWVVGLRAWF